MTKVDTIFDFGSTNTYLSHNMILDIAARTDLPFNSIPFLLGGLLKAQGFNENSIDALAFCKAETSGVVVSKRLFP
jgi:2-hydroxychromene-2-carboxylate isomerase